MEGVTLEKVEEVWKTWDISALMLCSLLIQTILTFLAPYRKRCCSGLLSFCMWLLYLTADAVALYTIGLIASAAQDPKSRKVFVNNNNDHHPGKSSILYPTRKAHLLAFWAPFLLLHLGGPDTITALALEDNELWHRHFLQLVTQVVLTIYVMVRSFHRNYYIWFPSLFIFFDGFIKYFERTSALYFASKENFRDSQNKKAEPASNARLMEEYSSAANAHLPTEIKGCDGSLDDNVVKARMDGNFPDDEGDYPASFRGIDRKIQQAYEHFNKFKGLLADSLLSLKDRDESRAFFLRKSPIDCYEIIQIELNFMYDVFYTKVFLLNRKRACARIFCFILVMLSLFLFCFADKNSYQPVDVGITLALLGGAIALDISTIVMFLLSDWWIIIAKWDSIQKPLAYPLRMLERWSNWARGHYGTRRWSESISGYNLLTRCLKSPPPLFNYFFIKRIQDLVIGWWFVKRNKVDNDLLNFIINELHTKAMLAADTRAREVCSARGNLVFQEQYSLVAEYLRPWTLDIDYDESLITWHLATDICYWTDSNKNDMYVKCCKTISDYMSYLVLQQQELVSQVVGASDVRFDDTCTEVKKFKKEQKLPDDLSTEQFCANILEEETQVQPKWAADDAGHSVFLDSCSLAKQLKLFGDKQWEVMSKVWVELFCYAATRCSSRSHVAMLSKGGELITLVWLLMAHLGLVEKISQRRGFAWIELIIHT